MKKILTLLFIVFIAGCSESHNSELSKLRSDFQERRERWEREDEEGREQALAALDQANSLNVFLEVQRDNFELGSKSLDINYISEKRRKWYVGNTPDLSDKIQKAILAGNWFIGMSRNDLYASIGIPKEINRTVTVGNVREQWVYGYDMRVQRTSTIYFYFKNGILTSWQD